MDPVGGWSDRVRPLSHTQERPYTPWNSRGYVEMAPSSEDHENPLQTGGELHVTM